VYAGSAFQSSVRKLVSETIPQVSEPPGNAAAFQASAVFLQCVEKPSGFSTLDGDDAIRADDGAKRASDAFALIRAFGRAVSVLVDPVGQAEDLLRALRGAQRAALALILGDCDLWQC